MRTISLEKISTVASRLIREEMLSRGVKFPEARKIVAREAGVSPGSLESLSRGRLKYVDRIADRINGLLIKKIEQKIESLKHELEIAKSVGNITRVDMDRAEASLEEARRALGK